VGGAVAFLALLFISASLQRSGISDQRWCRLEIADPNNDPAYAHKKSALVSTAHLAGRSLHVDKTAFGNGASDIGRFGTLAEFVKPIRDVILGDEGYVITLGHDFTLRV
jgi:hypothetical protein